MSYRVECELVSGVWDDITKDLLGRYEVTAKRGIFDHGPKAVVAGPGLMGFVLNNAAEHPSGRPAWLSNDLGRYSPGHANIWTRGGEAFKHGKRVRLRIGVNYHYSQLILAHDPIAYYRMNAKPGAGGTEPNVTGYTNPGSTAGTYGGGATLRQDGRTADADSAVDFDGVDSQMNTPLDETDIPNTAWTLEAWFQTSETGTIQPIIFRSGTTFRPGLYVTSGNVLAIASHDGSTLTTVSSATTVTDGEWHHAVGTYDGTTLRLYLDGESVGTPAAANGFLDTSTETFRVAVGGPVPDRFNGLIDEVALYAHCLSASQIQEHFEAADYAIGYADMVAGRIVDPNNPDDPGVYQPVAYYRLGDATGTTAVDEVGRHPSSDPNGANPGTYVNTPTLGATGAISDGDTAVTFTAASSEYVTTPLDETDIPNGGWSLEAWVNTTVTTGGRVIITRSNLKPRLAVSGTTAQVASNDGSTNVAVNGTSDIADGEWHHVVGTYDGTTLRLYVDGQPDGTPAAANPYDDGSSATFIIANQASGTLDFDGSLDEVAFYDFPLTAAQIAAHYAARTSTLGLRAGLIRYPFSGRLIDILPTSDEKGKREVSCVAEDWMGELSETMGLLDLRDGDPLGIAPPHDTQDLINDVIDLADRAPERESLGSAPDDKVFIAFDDLGDSYYSAVAAAQRVAETDLSAFFTAGDGTDGETVTWQHHIVRASTTAPKPAVVFTESDLRLEGGVEVPSAKDRVYNDVRTRIWPRRKDSSAVVIAGPLDHELPIEDGATLQVWVSYTNPNENSQFVGASTVITPVASTDWVANDTAGGGGTDVTASVSAAVTDFGSRALLEWTNNSGAKAYIRGVSDEGPRLRGFGIYRDEAIEYHREDQDSIDDFGRRPVVINMYYHGVYEDVESTAVAVLAAYKDLVNVPTVVRPRTAEPSVLRRCLGVELGDPITVSESLTAVDAETLRVNGVEYELRDGIVSIAYTVEPIVDLTP